MQQQTNKTQPEQKQLTVEDLRERGYYSRRGIIFEALYNEAEHTWDLYEVGERGALRIYPDGVMVALVLRHGEYETGERVGSVGDLEEVRVWPDNDDDIRGLIETAAVVCERYIRLVRHLATSLESPEHNPATEGYIQFHAIFCENVAQDVLVSLRNYAGSLDATKEEDVDTDVWDAVIDGREAKPF